jgi:hypothetical protein
VPCTALTVPVGTKIACARCDELKSKPRQTRHGEETANTVRLHRDGILADDRSQMAWMADGPPCFGIS